MPAERLRRHNCLARNVLKGFFQGMGWDWDETEIQTSLDSQERVDSLCLYCGHIYLYILYILYMLYRHISVHIVHIVHIVAAQ